MQRESNFYQRNLDVNETEKAVLSAVLLHGEKALRVSIEAGLDSSDFGKKQHEIIFSAMVDLLDSRRQIDTLAVVDHLVQIGKVGDAGGQAGVSQIEALIAPVGMVDLHSKTILNRAAIRRVRAAANFILEESQSETTAEILRNRAREMLDAVYTAEQGSFVDPFVVVDEVMNDIENPKKILGVTSGIAELDNMLGCFQGGSLILLGARPSMGKTALCLNMAISAAQYGHKVAVLSHEMPAKQLFRRCVSSISRIPLPPSRRQFNATEIRDLKTAAGQLVDLAIAVNDKGGQTLDDVLSSISKAVYDGAEIIFIDYLGLILPSRSSKYAGNTVREIAEITGALKSAAKRHDVPIVLLSQLSRGLEQRSDKRPMMSDLRDSGAIEQDADVIMFLYRDAYYQKEATEERERVAELLIQKNRMGQTGKIFLHFEGEISLFSETIPF